MLFGTHDKTNGTHRIRIRSELLLAVLAVTTDKACVLET